MLVIPAFGKLRQEDCSEFGLNETLYGWGGNLFSTAVKPSSSPADT